MKRLLIMSLFLTASAPALAFDLIGFMKTMSLGTEVIPVPPPTEYSVADGQTKGDSEPVKASRPATGGLELDSIWLMGVFR